MRVLAAIGFLAIVAAIAAVIFFFGGFYSVAASQPDNPVVAWVLQYVRQMSVARNASDSPPMSLDDPAVVQDGARAFLQRGCPQCHGAPGVEWAKFSEGLRPDPPDLKDIAAELPAPQIFWVVKNGINMTGMPSFGAIKVDDRELWSIVAFVKKLPSVSDADFKSWTASTQTPAPAPAAR
jgi:hypothetical protein